VPVLAGRPVPVLTTARLVMRGHRPSDLDASAAMWADDAVGRHIGGKPSTREESWSRLLRYAGLWALLGFGYWLVEERQTGAFVGEVGFADFKRDIEPSFGGASEAGWVLMPSAHGRGFATEALQAALQWADEHFGPHRSVCLIAPGNAPSLRVARKCGYAEFARSTYHGGSAILFERAATP
jgi:RimJ/RimL family protein N-acetyltransferase